MEIDDLEQDLAMLAYGRAILARVQASLRRSDRPRRERLAHFRSDWARLAQLRYNDLELGECFDRWLVEIALCFDLEVQN